MGVDVNGQDGRFCNLLAFKRGEMSVPGIDLFQQRFDKGQQLRVFVIDPTRGDRLTEDVMEGITRMHNVAAPHQFNKFFLGKNVGKAFQAIFRFEVIGDVIAEGVIGRQREKMVPGQ
jgi:hypothetical protein